MGNDPALDLGFVSFWSQARLGSAFAKRLYQGYAVTERLLNRIHFFEMLSALMVALEGLEKGDLIARHLSSVGPPVSLIISLLCAIPQLGLTCALWLWFAPNTTKRMRWRASIAALRSLPFAITTNESENIEKIRLELLSDDRSAWQLSMQP